MRWLHGEPARDDRGSVIETLSIRRIRAADLGKAPAALATQLKTIIKQRACGCGCAWRAGATHDAPPAQVVANAEEPKAPEA